MNVSELGMFNSCSSNNDVFSAGSISGEILFSDIFLIYLNSFVDGNLSQIVCRILAKCEILVGKGVYNC